MDVYNLKPIYSSRKSFYSRAYIIEENGTYELYSYATLVARIKDNKFEYLWDNWSNTTGCHVKEFLLQHGFPKMSKQQILAHKKH